MSEFEFLKPRLDGPRFEDHAIPLDFLKDLAAFEEFVISVAKAEWRKDHSGRQRTPRGFMSGVAFKLKQVDEGSAIPVLTVFIASATNLLPNTVSPQQAYLERARTRIVEAVSAAETGGNPRSRRCRSSPFPGVNDIHHRRKPATGAAATESCSRRCALSR